MSKQIKGMIISQIQDRVGETKDFLVIDTSRMDAITTNEFRLHLQKSNISALAVKNALARRALNDMGVTALDEYLKGPSTLIWGGEDIVALSKEMMTWSKKLEPLVVKGGAVEGTAVDAAGVEALSKSPSREELIGQIVGLALSPGSRLAGALLGPARTIAGQAKAISEKED